MVIVILIVFVLFEFVMVGWVCGMGELIKVVVVLVVGGVLVMILVNMFCIIFVFVMSSFFSFVFGCNCGLSDVVINLFIWIVWLVFLGMLFEVIELLGEYVGRVGWVICVFDGVWVKFIFSSLLVWWLCVVVEVLFIIIVIICIFLCWVDVIRL